MDEVHASHFRLAIHANGDVSIEYVLNAYERALAREARPNHRWRIEHCTLVNPGLVQRIRDFGVIPAPFYSGPHLHDERRVRVARGS